LSVPLETLFVLLLAASLLSSSGLSSLHPDIITLPLTPDIITLVQHMFSFQVDVRVRYPILSCGPNHLLCGDVRGGPRSRFTPWPRPLSLDRFEGETVKGSRTTGQFTEDTYAYL